MNISGNKEPLNTMLTCLVMCELVRTLQEMGDNKLGNDHSKNTDRNMEDVCVVVAMPWAYLRGWGWVGEDRR